MFINTLLRAKRQLTSERRQSNTYPECIKNSKNSLRKRQTMEKENGQKTSTDPSQKATSKWPINNEKALKLHKENAY